MRCEDARSKIVENQADDPQLREHVAQCADCGELAMIHRDVSQRMSTWQDEAPPISAKRLVPFPERRPRFSWWMTVAPLAACLILAFALTSRLYVTKDELGLHIGFGQPPQLQTAVDEDSMRDYVDEALTRMQQQNVYQMRGLLAEYRRDQNQAFAEIIDELNDDTRRERREDLRLIVDAWQEQRGEDLDLFERQINLLMTKQERQADNLVQLTGYLNRRSGRGSN